jgi:hypothetical protein
VAGKYDGPINARREEDARRKVLEAEREARERAEREAEEWKQRARVAVYKAEYAYEVLRAILLELRKGQAVSKPSLTNAFTRLQDVPDEFKRNLLAHDTRLDVELRKDDPQRR